MKSQSPDKEKVWLTVLSAMKTAVSEGSFNAYLKNTQLNDIKTTGSRVVCDVGCSSSFIKNTLEQRFWGQLNLELERVTGKKCETVFSVLDRKTEETEIPSGPLFEQKKPDDYVFDYKKANLKEDFTFENFAVGGSNQMAYAAAQAVAKKVGSAYNPLFIWGGVGVGKTHLMQAIGHAVVRGGGGSALFCSGEEFTNDLVEAIRFKSTDKVRAKYRKLKLLLIDDVQFIAGKPSVQEEFFHTFNTLLREGGQVVMTSDKPPEDIAKLEERLRSRFGAGLIVDIGPADFELRTAILLIKAKQRDFELGMEKAQLIAANIEGVRELQGFLIKLETEERLRGKGVPHEELERMLNVNGSENGRTRVITPTEVINTVGNYYGVGVQQLKGERRTKTIVWPRQILMYLLRQELRLPLEEVGRLVGGRDHTTVLHAAEKVKGEIEQNHKFQAELAEVRKRIFSTPG
jgi:chromosomal replication initiator protein